MRPHSPRFLRPPPPIRCWAGRAEDARQALRQGMYSHPYCALNPAAAALELQLWCCGIISDCPAFPLPIRPPSVRAQVSSAASIGLTTPTVSLVPGAPPRLRCAHPPPPAAQSERLGCCVFGLSVMRGPPHRCRDRAVGTSTVARGGSLRDCRPRRFFPPPSLVVPGGFNGAGGSGRGFKDRQYVWDHIQTVGGAASQDRA